MRNNIFYLIVVLVLIAIPVVGHAINGTEGCTPGYWKAPQHVNSWISYQPGDMFEEVFNRIITVLWNEGGGKPYEVQHPTLQQALEAKGGGINALARHSVAALLNAINTEVNYQYTVVEIIEMFQQALDSGDLETTKNLFADANELCCPLDDGVIPDWTNIPFSPFENISEEGINNPVLTAMDVTDLENPDFVADPFLFYENDMWYMFFEIGRYETVVIPSGTYWGRIGLATSSDGLSWEYDSIVLQESTHHSYPLIIKYRCRYYMITESFRQRQIRFYEATDFPYGWERVYTITKCGDVPEVSPGQCIETSNSSIGYLDPSVFRYNDKWWMFGGQGGDCYLYFSDELLNGWAEHPLSPIVSGDGSMARPGGRAFVFDGDRIVRLAQKGNVRYGQRVRAFEVIALTEDEYDEYEISGGAPFCLDGGVFCERGDSESCANTTSCQDREDIWNLCGMHNLDSWWAGNYWLMVTDGYKCLQRNDDWSIGIYISVPD